MHNLVKTKVSSTRDENIIRITFKEVKKYMRTIPGKCEYKNYAWICARTADAVRQCMVHDGACARGCGHRRTDALAREQLQVFVAQRGQSEIMFAQRRGSA